MDIFGEAARRRGGHPPAHPPRVGRVRPGVIAVFGYGGGVVRFEVLEASKVVDRTREVQFAHQGE